MKLAILLFLASSVVIAGEQLNQVQIEQLMVPQQIFVEPPTIQEQLSDKQEKKCQERINYYSERIRHGTFDWYEQYMLKKWEERCSN